MTHHDKPTDAAIGNTPTAKAAFRRKPDGLLGRIDAIDADLNVQGWACADDSRTVEIELVVGGQTVATALADRARPDLLVAGIANASAGFRVAIPASSITGPDLDIQVKAEDTLLTNGLGAISLVNHIQLADLRIEDGYLRIGAERWPGLSIDVDLYVDGAFTMRASLIRNLQSRAAAAEYFWPLPSPLQDGQPHVYWAEVPHKQGKVQSDTAVLRYPSYRFAIDTTTMNSVAGWVVKNDGSDRLDLCLRWQGRQIARSHAVHVRQDVKVALDLHASRHGFKLDFDTHFPEHHACLDMVDQDTGIVIARLSLSNRYEALRSLAANMSRTASNRTDVVSAISALATKLDDSDTVVIDATPAPISHATSSTVDVVIPIYGGAAETAACLRSVLKAENKTPCRLILVNDCTPDPSIQEMLDELARQGLNNIQIVTRTKNGGFSQAVNIGMTLGPDRDVILLNADTVVQDHWIDRLVAAAAHDVRIGTVTPLSNNGEICTIPYMCKSLEVATPELAATVDRIAALVNPESIVDLPVAIGFCMLIKRACIAEIGYFDAEKWGRGYGEEVDFCLKAAARGWRNVLTGDTFVVHRGGVSFGDEKLSRILESSKKISTQYPFYDKLIQRFLRKDPARAIRRNINTSLLGQAIDKPVILHVTHAFGGGTQRYVSDICALYRASGYENVVLEFDARMKASLRVSTHAAAGLKGFFATEHTEEYASNEQSALKADLSRFGIRHVHLHGPFGVDAEIMAWLTAHHQFDITVHDYSWVCPWVTLTGPDGKYHGDNADLHALAYPAHEALRHWVDHADGDIKAYRRYFSDIFARARHVFVGTRDVAMRMTRYGFDRNYLVRAHPRLRPVPPTSPYLSKKRRRDIGEVSVGLIGAISDIKGYWRLQECAEFAHSRRLPIRFTVYGNTSNDDLFDMSPNVDILGRYAEEDLARLLQKYRPDLLIFPNESPETFSYVLSHAFDHGIWPVVTDIGAPAERVRDLSFGSVIPLDATPADICRTLLALVQENLDDVRNAPPPPPQISLSFDDYLRGVDG